MNVGRLFAVSALQRTNPGDRLVIKSSKIGENTSELPIECSLLYILVLRGLYPRLSGIETRSARMCVMCQR